MKLQSRMGGLLTGMAALGLLFCTWNVSSADSESGGLRAKGRAIFSTHCARCHGENGADTTTYVGAKSLVDITQRLDTKEVIEKSKGFATVQLQGVEAAALFAHLDTFGSGKWPNSELLVETEWVSKHLKDANVRLIDMRSDAAYAAGHIPGAVRIAEGPTRSQ